MVLARALKQCCQRIQREQELACVVILDGLSGIYKLVHLYRRLLSLFTTYSMTSAPQATAHPRAPLGHQVGTATSAQPVVTTRHTAPHGLTAPVVDCDRRRRAHTLNSRN